MINNANPKGMTLLLFLLANIIFVISFFSLARFNVYLTDINFMLKYFHVSLIKVRSMQFLFLIAFAIVIWIEVYIMKLIFGILKAPSQKLLRNRIKPIKMSSTLLWILCAIVVIISSGVVMKLGEYSQELIKEYKVTRQSFIWAYSILLAWLYSMVIGFAAFAYTFNLYQRSK